MRASRIVLIVVVMFLSSVAGFVAGARYERARKDRFRFQLIDGKILIEGVRSPERK